MKSIRSFLKKVLYALGANIISLLVSLLVTLILPKFFGDDLEQYGYLQIYVFYIAYVGFFHFGLCDGIYLRDAGKEYNQLDKPLYSSQFWILMGVELIIGVALGLIGGFFSKDVNYAFIFLMLGLNIVLVLPRTMIQYFLQTTNRIKEYSVIATIERALYGVLLIFIFLFLYIDFRIVILADIIAKIIALVIAIFYCKDIIFTKPCALKTGLRECKTNIGVGLKLMFSNIANMLVTGIVRIGIQQKWDVVTYGKISFTLSVSSFILVFISAVGAVLYPTLRQSSKENLPKLYSTLRDVLMVPLLGSMIFYYPLEILLSLWLPQYAESIKFIAILFPLCIYAAKMTMLVQTYMNVYRLEKSMLIVNCIGVAFALLTTVVSVFIFESLVLAMVSIVVNQMFRCVCSEIVLRNKIKVCVVKDIILEIILTIAFILANWFIGGWIGVITYLIIFIFYCIFERQKIKNIFNYIKNFVKYKNKTGENNGTN